MADHPADSRLTTWEMLHHYRYTLVFLYAVAFLLRVAAGLTVSPVNFRSPLENDEPEYYQIARSIIDGVGRAKQINVRQFIADLGSDPDQSADSQSQPRATDNPAQPRSEATRDGNPGGKLNGRT